jgi:hypothetical protein
MASTSSRFADFIAQANRAWPHRPTGPADASGKYVFASVDPGVQRDPDPQSPAGGVSSSVNDLAKWMMMILQNGSYGGQPVVQPAALLPAITAQIVSAPSGSADARPGAYGFGFNVSVEASGRTRISHSGAFLMGAGTSFSMLPSAGVGIVVLTNAAPLGVAETLSAEFTDLVQYGSIKQDWWGLYAPAFVGMNAPIGELAGKTPPASPAPALAASAYVGSYGNDYFGNPPAYDNAAVTAQPDGSLLLTMPGPAGKPHLQYPLRHWDGNTFVFDLTGEDGSPGSVSQAIFDVSGATAQSVYLEYYKAEGMGLLGRR